MASADLAAQSPQTGVYTWGNVRDTGALGHEVVDAEGDCPLPVKASDTRARGDRTLIRVGARVWALSTRPGADAPTHARAHTGDRASLHQLRGRRAECHGRSS